MRKTIVCVLSLLFLTSCTNNSISQLFSTTTPTSTITSTPTITLTPTSTFTPTPTFTPSPTPLAGSGYIDFLYYFLFTDGEWVSRPVVGTFELNNTQSFQNDQISKEIINESDWVIEWGRIEGIQINQSDYSKLMSVPNREVKFIIGSEKNPNYLLVTYVFDYINQDVNPSKIPYEIFWGSNNGLISIYKINCERDIVLGYSDQDYYLSPNGHYALVDAVTCSEDSDVFSAYIVVNLDTGDYSVLQEMRELPPFKFSFSPDETKIAFDTWKGIYLSDINGIIDSTFAPVDGHDPSWISDSKFVYLSANSKQVMLYDLPSMSISTIYKTMINSLKITDVAFLSENEILVFQYQNWGGKTDPCSLIKVNIDTGEQTTLFSTNSVWSQFPKNRIIISPDQKWFIADITRTYDFSSMSGQVLQIFGEMYILCNNIDNKCVQLQVKTPYCVATNSDASLCIRTAEKDVDELVINFR